MAAKKAAANVVERRRAVSRGLKVSGPIPKHFLESPSLSPAQRKIFGRSAREAETKKSPRPARKAAPAKKSAPAAKAPRPKARTKAAPEIVVAASSAEA